ncbi:MAG: hypothetical protein E7297_02175 [Lachnospiraceae bacterium]|nr:hypothetical protein [Lachnospiraceae bacterium]
MNNKTPGVWILLGRNETAEKWECLQVGINVDIYQEIVTDIDYMYEQGKTEKDYINQFGEKCEGLKIFAYPSEHNQLYSFIRNTYENLAFVIVAENVEELEKRKTIEKYVAYRTRAKYWRNGRAYEKEATVKNEDLSVDISAVMNYVIEIDKFLEKYIIIKGIGASK